MPETQTEGFKGRWVNPKAKLKSAAPSTARKAPNPFLFFAITTASFGAFYYLTKKRAANNSPTSRQHDNPLVPPIRRKEDQQQ